MQGIFSNRWPPFLLLAVTLSLVIFVIPLVIAFPLLDPDEGLHASIAQEMVERGDWIVPRFLNEPFLDKPILYFWCQAASLSCFGMNEFAIRLPGLLFGLLGCLTTGIVGGRMFGRTVGFISGIFYGTMLLPVAFSQVPVHDVVLVPCVNIALLLFWESDRARSWKSSVAFTVAIGLILGLTMLAKGLMGIALVGAAYGSYLLLTRQLSWAACFRGAVALFLAGGIASIWYLAVEQKQPGFLYYYFVERHLLGFATSTQTHGDAPWWLYFPTLLGGSLPWIGYVPITLREIWLRRSCTTKASPANVDESSTHEKPVFLDRTENEQEGIFQHPQTTQDTSLGLGKPTSRRVWKLERGSSSRPEILLFCWAIVCTLLLTLAQSKLATYIWPVFPSVAILASMGWAKLIDGNLSPTSQQAFLKNFRSSSRIAPFVLPITVVVLQQVFQVEFNVPTWIFVAAAGISTLAPLLFLPRVPSTSKTSNRTTCNPHSSDLPLMKPGRGFALLASSTLSTAAQFLVIMALLMPVLAEFYTEKRLAEHFNIENHLPKRVLFAEVRIGSFVFYLDPSLRASLCKDRLQKIARPDDPSEEWKIEPGDVLIVPESRLTKAEEYLDLKDRPYEKVGCYRLFRDRSTPKPH